MEELLQKGIGTQVHYIPVNSQPHYIKICGEYNPKFFPITESYYQKCLTIPLYPKMSDSDVEYVIESISIL